MRSKSVIYFHFLQVGAALRDRQELKKFITKLFKREGEVFDTINYIFCSDEYLLEINRNYLKHDTLTDIITFPLYEKGQPISSDIYISIDRVRDNATIFHTSFKRELHRVIFHGALHLCGYEDKTKADAKLMRDMEEFYLNQYLVPRGTRSK